MDQVVSEYEWGTGGHMASQDSPRAHRGCLSAVSPALEPCMLRTRRDTQGSRGSWAGQTLAPRKGCRRESVFTPVYRPQWKRWVPTCASPLLPPTPPLDYGTFASAFC